MKHAGIAGVFIVLLLSSCQSVPPKRATAELPNQPEANLLDTSCKTGDNSACDRLGNWLMAQPDAGLHALAVGYYDRACEGGHRSGCGDLAAAYDVGIGVAKDRPKARALFRRACDNDHALSCLSLANIFDLGDGVPRNVPAAMNYYQLACEGGQGQGCNALGFFYDHGLDVPRDPAKSRYYYDKACDLGLVATCRAGPSGD